MKIRGSMVAPSPETSLYIRFVGRLSARFFVGNLAMAAYSVPACRDPTRRAWPSLPYRPQRSALIESIPPHHRGPSRCPRPVRRRQLPADYGSPQGEAALPRSIPATAWKARPLKKQPSKSQPKRYRKVMHAISISKSRLSWYLPPRSLTLRPPGGRRPPSELLRTNP